MGCSGRAVAKCSPRLRINIKIITESVSESIIVMYVIGNLAYLYNV